MSDIFLDASILQDASFEDTIRFDVQQNRIKFVFPQGFAQLRLIEECRALNALDITNEDNFDLMYDITMQMLVGKPVFVYFIDDDDSEIELGKFVVTDRYMNLRGVDILDEYPILVNWLIEFVAAHLGKKYPHSLKDFRSTMSAREERMKSLRKSEEKKQTV